MDYIWIGIRAFTYVIIFTLIKIIVPKLLFVECKTQIAKTTDIDKFRSVVKTYGGTGSKGLFVTKEKLSDVARAKCIENAILSFSFKDAENWNLQPEKALALLLDNELFNINAK